MLSPHPESLCTCGVRSETTNRLVYLFLVLSVNTQLLGAKPAYILFLYLPIDSEVKGLCDVLFVLGAAQGAESNIALVTVASILVGIVDDLPL